MNGRALPLHVGDARTRWPAIGLGEWDNDVYAPVRSRTTTAVPIWAVSRAGAALWLLP